MVFQPLLLLVVGPPLDVGVKRTDVVYFRRVGIVGIGFYERLYALQVVCGTDVGELYVFGQAVVGTQYDTGRSEGIVEYVFFEIEDYDVSERLGLYQVGFDKCPIIGVEEFGGYDIGAPAVGI